MSSLENPFGDWTEDFGSENGCYLHVCRECGAQFSGHKRRPSICRECHDKAKARWDKLTPEQKAAETKQQQEAIQRWMKERTR